MQKAQTLTPELARQMLHNAAFFIELKREAFKRGLCSKDDLAKLQQYEKEAEMLRNWLQEHDDDYLNTDLSK